LARKIWSGKGVSMGYDAQGGFTDGVWGMESDMHLEGGLGMKNDRR
jgi:hypothetical protein